MKFIPCKPSHLLMVDLQHAQIDQTTRQEVAHDPKTAEQLANFAISMEHEGRILACFGIVMRWKGVAEAWALLSAEALREHPVALTFSVAKYLRRAEQRETLRRIQAAVEDGHEVAHRWLHFLGFDREGFMPHYGYGGQGDFWLYARVR